MEKLAMQDYLEMLDAVYAQITPKEEHSFRLPFPDVTMIGKKKVCCANFTVLCGMMNRPVDHVMSFVLTELSTEGSIDSTGAFLIAGKYSSKQIETILGKYLTEYVMCRNCRNFRTEIQRDSTQRLQYLHCEDCKSRRTIPPIDKGFHATAKGQRKKDCLK